MLHLEGSLCRVNGFPGNWQVKEDCTVEAADEVSHTHTHTTIRLPVHNKYHVDKSSHQTCIGHVLQPKSLLADISASQCDQFRQPMVYKFLPRMREREEDSQCKCYTINKCFPPRYFGSLFMKFKCVQVSSWCYGACNGMRERPTPCPTLHHHRPRPQTKVKSNDTDVHGIKDLCAVGEGHCP